jgi:hypothetical protein
MITTSPTQPGMMPSRISTVRQDGRDGATAN